MVAHRKSKDQTSHHRKVDRHQSHCSLVPGDLGVSSPTVMEIEIPQMITPIISHQPITHTPQQNFELQTANPDVFSPSGAVNFPIQLSQKYGQRATHTELAQLPPEAKLAHNNH